MRRAMTSLALATVLGARCTKSAPGGTSQGKQQTAVAEAQPTRDAGGATPNWIQAVRWSSWSEADRALGSLDDKSKSRPEMRYVRARVALSLGRHAEAAALLDGLEAHLPLLKADIEHWRAECQLVAGPFDRAAGYFTAQVSVEGFIKAARAHLRDGKVARARSAIDRALALTAQTEKASELADQQARARAVRARILEQQGQLALAIADLRWLALSATTHPHAANAAAEIGRLSPKSQLSARDHYTRALAMADRGWVDRVEQELRLAKDAHGPKPTEAELLRARGLARSAARVELRDAARALEQAAALDPVHGVRDLFRAARAWSRAMQDARAIRVYGEILRKAPGSSAAEQARFLSARLHLIGGRWDEAIQAFSNYVTRYGRKGPHIKSATYFRAVAWLAEGRFADAAKAFQALAQDEHNEGRRARYLELWGASLEGQKDFGPADQVLRRVILEHPLSFPALAAAARLRTRGATVPPAIARGKLGPPRPPLSPELSPKARLLAQLGLDADAEAEVMTHEEEIKQRHPSRSAEALCTTYGQLSTARQRYQIGQRAAGWQPLNTGPTPLSRWLWECIYPQPYGALVRSVEVQHQLPSELLYAIMRQESAFCPDAKSPAEAVGLMQIIPSTAQRLIDQIGAHRLGAECSKDMLVSPACSVRMGGAYVRQLLDMFGGRVTLAAASYNAGPHAVSRWLETGEKLPIDVFVARIPYDETRNYVVRVVGNFARYRHLAGGPAVDLGLEIPRGLRATATAF